MYMQHGHVGQHVTQRENGNILLTCNSRICFSFRRSNQIKNVLPDQCQQVTDQIAAYPLPSAIKKEIERSLEAEFEHKVLPLEQRLFSIRSSACGEDSEEMSAAGQMTTVLGVRGLENIYQAVMKCWASQFGHIAVQYKRGYGQLINGPMAVVIQEMVECDAAGVMFTCDPLSGDEREIILTANYGLGESVVSASAEPDTVKLTVDVRRALISGIKKIELGSKTSVIKVHSGAPGGGTMESQVGQEDRNKCCISQSQALEIGQIGLAVSTIT